MKICVRRDEAVKKIAAAVAVVFAIALVGSAAWPFSNSGTTYSGTPEPISIGIPAPEAFALIFIAEDQGFFAENGLDVTIKCYDTGVQAFDDMEKGDADLSGTSEYPLVSAALNKKDFGVIGCVDKAIAFHIVGRKDRGITNISDLRGKTIGLARGGIGEFYLGRFLDLHGMSLRDVTLVEMKYAQSAQTMSRGSVDACLAQNRDIDRIKELLGSNAVIWPTNNLQAVYSVIAGKSDWVSRHPETINRFLKSISQAENYALSYPTESKAILQKRLNYTEGYMATVWPQHQYSLTLDMSLLTAMEDEGRWMIANNLTSEKTIPDFRDYIYTKGLEEVKPESVNIR